MKIGLRRESVCREQARHEGCSKDVRSELQEKFPKKAINLLAEFPTLSGRVVCVMASFRELWKCWRDEFRIHTNV